MHSQQHYEFYQLYDYIMFIIHLLAYTPSYQLLSGGEFLF